MLLSTIAALIYVVMPGDTLGEIARDHGTTVAVLAAANDIDNPNLIYVGDELVISGDAPLQLERVAPVADVFERHFGADAPWARRLVACESGGVFSINTGNGYYGAYQFDLPTWRSVGGWGYPHLASADEQTRRAKMLFDARGIQPWPYCGRR